MKISHKLIYGYLAIAFLSGLAGYISFSIYKNIKYKIVRFNDNSIVDFGSSNELLLAIEKCQTSAEDLVKNKYKIIYKLPDSASRARPQVPRKKIIKANIAKLEQFLSGEPFNEKHEEFQRGSKESKKNTAKEMKQWLDLRKRDFYYHWKYLSYFISLADQNPEAAYDFFNRTLEPHYEKNIYPLIERYRQKAFANIESQMKTILDDYLPNADIIIVISTIGTLLTISFLGLWTSHSVSRPINKLTQAALEVGQGRLDTKVDIQSSDEVGILAKAFNQMASDLKRTTVSKTFVDDIIRSMLDTLIVVNMDAAITKANQSALQLLGYDLQELLGMDINAIISDETGSGSSIIGEITSKTLVANIEKIYLTKSGVRIPVLFSGSIMCDDSGNPEGIVCVARDIIERKKAEAALKKAKDELEQRVEERTVELLETNNALQKEIEERRRTEKALLESKEQLRLLSSQLLQAQEKERRHISLELHDELGQALSLLKIQMSTVRRKLRPDQSDLNETLGQARENLNHVIDNVRRISRDLTPSILEDLGLTAAIERLISEFIKHFQVETVANITNVDGIFRPEQQIIIYRILQEILANSGKHSNAGKVTISVRETKKKVSFVVEDDGKGFDINQVLHKSSLERGMGLTAMYERALIVGGSLEIWAENGKGTKISFDIPKQ